MQAQCTWYEDQLCVTPTWHKLMKATVQEVRPDDSMRAVWSRNRE